MVAALQNKSCLKCLRRKHEGECGPATKPFLCPKHGKHQIICKCSDSKWKHKIQQNSTNIVNKATMGAIGFDSEWIIIRNKGKMRKTLLTYDSFASHTTLNKALKEDLCLEETSIGDIEIQT